MKLLYYHPVYSSLFKPSQTDWWYSSELDCFSFDNIGKSDEYSLSNWIAYILVTGLLYKAPSESSQAIMGNPLFNSSLIELESNTWSTDVHLPHLPINCEQFDELNNIGRSYKTSEQRLCASPVDHGQGRC